MTEGRCECCGESVELADLNVEAFEVTGEILCPLCAESAFEELADDPD